MAYHEEKLQVIQDYAQHLTKLGFPVYLAESGTHGFFTDDTGERVVSFQFDFFEIHLSGNYTANSEGGTGWQLSNHAGHKPTRAQVVGFLTANAPQWAMRDSRPIYTTADAQLERYGKSSGYALFEKES
jgi:hypothetical protein